MNYENLIGHKVFKARGNREPKKFKSGSKFNTVKGVIEHPILKVSAFIFEEDDSYVRCSDCRHIDEFTNSGTTTIEHKKKSLDKASNTEQKKTIIYDWVSSGQLLRDELWDLIDYCKQGISKNQIRKQYTGNEDPELILP